jgi:hypothetical protein
MPNAAQSKLHNALRKAGELSILVSLATGLGLAIGILMR